MDNEALNDSWDSFLDETISHYIGCFPKEHAQYGALKEKFSHMLEELKQTVPETSYLFIKEIRATGQYNADIMGAYMYAKGLKDGLLTVQYLDKGYIEQELSRCELTIQNMVFNEE